MAVEHIHIRDTYSSVTQAPRERRVQAGPNTYRESEELPAPRWNLPQLCTRVTLHSVHKTCQIRTRT